MKYIFKILLNSIFIYTFLINISIAAKINNIIIIGNERIANETIILFSELDLNQDISSDTLNNSLKKLYDTGYFETINIITKNNDVIITVKEYKIIQTTDISGLKNKSIIKEISDLIKTEEKTSFFKEKVQISKNNILNMLRSYGFYFAEVNPKIIENQNNSVDINYEIITGERATINKINFIGNNNIKDKKLRNIIVSEEDKFWKFITRNKYLDINRIELDERLLTNYYKNRGYYDAKVESSFAKLSEDKNFQLTFKINSGVKYYFNEIKFDIPEDYSSENFSRFDKIFKELKGKKYSLNAIEKIIKEINRIALIEEFQFINAKYNEEIFDKNKINLSINFAEAEKIYIERINVYGNYITDEKVIRNTLIVDEGDPLNQLLFEKSIQDLKAKNIFKTVKKEIIESKEDASSRIVNITVEEKPTGEIFAGLGAGTEGTSISAGIKENNYLGKGIGLTAKLAVSDNKIKGIFDVNNPNFKNTDRSLSTTIESSSLDYMSTSGYKSSRTGFALGTSFEQLDDLYFSPKISTYYETIDTSANASANKKKQEGNYFETLFSYGLTVNKLNQNFQPSDGFRTTFRQTVPIYSSDDVTFQHSFDGAKYLTYADDLVFSAKIYAEAVNSIDEDVRVSKRVFIPSRKLRGFTPGKIGPQDGGEYIGGNYGAAINLTSDLPLFSESQYVDFNIFLDIADVWGVDYSKLLDDSKIRSSTGVGLDWFTPVGPLTFSFAIPLTKEHTDETETIRFNIGTSF
tara:strand:+ start:10110 stop:12356 length:2247 start_codon:yes stop_codon:yes gene_type:complete